MAGFQMPDSFGGNRSIGGAGNTKHPPGWYPVGSYSFLVLIGGREVGFQRVSGIHLMDWDTEMETKTVLDRGGPKITRIPAAKTDRIDSVYHSEDEKGAYKKGEKVLTLEKAYRPRYAGQDGPDDQEFLFSLIREKGLVIPEIQIRLRDAARNPIVTFLFYQCTVVSYDLSDLDAMHSTYVRQTIRIRYQQTDIRQE